MVGELNECTNTGSNNDRTPEKTIRLLIDKESTILSHHNDSHNESQNSAWREKVAEWYYEVIDRLEDNREIAFISMRILDSYVESCTPSSDQVLIHSRRLYQTAAMTCLLMAMKICGRKNFGIDNLLRMANGSIQRKDIAIAGKRIMGRVVVKSILPTTPVTFCEAFVQLLPAHKDDAKKSLLENARFFTETSVLDSNFIHLSPSVIAIACIVASIRLDETSIGSYTPDEISTFYSTLSTLTGVDPNASHIQILEFNLRMKNSSVRSGVKSRQKPNKTVQTLSSHNKSGIVPIVSEEDLSDLETRQLSRKRHHVDNAKHYTQDDSYLGTSCTMTKRSRSMALKS